MWSAESAFAGIAPCEHSNTASVERARRLSNLVADIIAVGDAE